MTQQDNLPSIHNDDLRMLRAMEKAESEWVALMRGRRYSALNIRPGMTARMKRP